MSDILENTHALMDGCFNGRRKEKRQQQQQQLINDLEASLDELVVTGQELAGTDTIQVLDHPPTPLEFYRFVAANRPVLIKNVTHNWPAMHSWQKDSYLASILGKSTQITVAATPNGYADAVVDNRWFAEPAERQMSFGQFIQILRAELADQGLLDDVDLQKDQLGGDNDAAWNATRQTFPGVHYIQSQNGNLSGEFAPLANDIPIDIDFATTALGKQPDAVNFWMGTGRSVTSLHKDPYENLYAVISGAKQFTLFPPTSQPCLYEGLYDRAQYDANTLELLPIEPYEQIPWIPIDPIQVSDQLINEHYPRYKQAQSLSVTVHPGDVLFLPSMWYHHVRQQGRTVAVNWWYDMEYGSNYAYLMFVRNISSAIREAKNNDTSSEEEKE